MKVIEKVDRSFWIEIAENCPYATFFHTPYWSDLMIRTFSYVDVTKGFLFDNGARVIFPFMCTGRHFPKTILRDYISGPLFVYGGPISDNEINEQQMNEILEYIGSAFRSYNSIIIRGNPYRAKLAVEGFQKVSDYSHVVELFNFTDEESLFKSNNAYKYKKRIQKGKEADLIIKKATSLDECEVIYNIYRKLRSSWVSSLTDFPLFLFQNIFRMENSGMMFWTVYKDARLIGGEIAFNFNRYCCSFLAFFDSEYNKLEPRRYLEHNIFSDCTKKGIKYYDFMQSGGIEAVEQFKRSMGGKIYYHDAWLKENKIFAKLRQIKNKFKVKNHLR